MDQTVTKVKEEPEATDRWHLWCRLCAKEDPQGNINLCSKEEDQRNSNANLSLLATVGLYFSVNIADDEILPKTLCVECHRVISSLVTFHERVAKVQQMFSTLQFAKEGEHLDLHTIRLKYGLLDKQPLPEICYCDTKQNINEIDSKSVPVEQSDPLEQANFDIKTKHDDEVPMNGLIGLEMIQDCSDDVENAAIENNDITYFVKFPSVNGPRYMSERDSHSLPTKKPIPKGSCKKPLSSDSDGLNGIGFLGDGLSESDSRYNSARDSHSSPIKKQTPKRLCKRPKDSDGHRKLERKHTCEECGKTLKGSLRRHLLTHTKEKPFVCSSCESAFSQKSSLHRHQRTCIRCIVFLSESESESPTLL